MTARKKAFLAGYGPLIAAIILAGTVLGTWFDMKADIAYTGKAAGDHEMRLRKLEEAVAKMSVIAEDIHWIRNHVESREKETPDEK